MGSSKKNKRRPKRKGFFATDPGFNKSRNRSGPSFAPSRPSKKHGAKSHPKRRAAGR